MRSTSICYLLALCALGSTVGAAENQLTPAEQKAGWKLLFNGTSTAGWRNFKKDTVNPGWRVENGELTRADKGSGDIITVDQYDHFELSLEYKISPQGNSGIIFHVTEEANTPWMTGPEIQVQDNAGRDPQKAGWLYQLYQPPIDPKTGQITDATRPPGEWNHVQFRIAGGKAEINMNGVRYAVFVKGSDDWNKRVAASKFKAFEKFGKPEKGHICLQDHNDLVAYRNVKIRVLTPEGSAPNPVDGVLPVKVVPALTDIEWTGWNPVSEAGKPVPFRPIILTHAGDQSGRIFVATQQGVIHALDRGQTSGPSKIFGDITPRVKYTDRQNEEGFLGMAFHPKFAANGEVYVYYTSSETPLLSIVSRFKSPDRQRLDVASEEVLMRIPQPFWNHNGGTIAFGPDGYLYIGLGDGGAGNDPLGNGQNLATWLGSILRIDVNSKQGSKNYAIPADNPFVGLKHTQPEIFAYGFRNIWRLSFDRQGGTLWAADVGQNLWEEINIVVKGGNYGWNLREATHPFGPAGSWAREGLIEPVWEYDHQVGKSITGGYVYRGTKVPALAGKYLYADYVSGKLWALDYDVAQKTLKGNYSIPSEPLPVITYGEDESGEVYFTTVTGNGKGIYTFAAE